SHCPSSGSVNARRARPEESGGGGGVSAAALLFSSRETARRRSRDRNAARARLTARAHASREPSDVVSLEARSREMLGPKVPRAVAVPLALAALSFAAAAAPPARVYVTNEKSGTVSVIDSGADRIVATVDA